MNVADKTVLITGANRGIGRAMVHEALRRGAKRVYAGTRCGEIDIVHPRLTALALDLTSPHRRRPMGSRLWPSMNGATRPACGRRTRSTC